MTDPMLDSFAQLSATAVPVLGRALLHFLWQGAVIGAFAAVALHCARNARPQVRYALACGALLACVLVPATSVAWRLSAPEAATAVVLVDAQVWLTRSPEAFARPFAAPVPALDAAMPWIVALWASGAFTLSLRMAMGLLWIQRLRAAAPHPQQAAWQARLDALAERFGEKRRVVLKLVGSLASPVSAGWWRPVVVMPAALLSRMPTDLIEALLAHELAHVRRHDYLVNLLQGVAEALLFYHPVTWWLSRRIRDEREHIADRMAAEVTGQPRRLALALCELSELNAASHAHATPHLAQAAHGGPLMSRIEQLVRPGHRSARIGVALPLVGVAAACLAFYAHAQIDSKPAAAAPAATATPAAQAPAAAPAAAARSVAAARTGRRDERLSYALISKDRDGITMSGSTDDLPEIRAARRSLPGSDFVWFRRNGQAYVISDADTMTRIQDAWRESRAIGDRMKALGDEMEIHGRKMEALGRQMEQLSPAASDTSAIEATSRRMEALSEQQAELAAKQARLAADMARAGDNERAEREASIDRLAEEQRRIGELMEEQGRLMEQQSERMQANSEPMEALGRQMDEAGKPMDALGRQMDALGKEQKKVIDAAERRTQDIIDSAMARGLAQPLPRLTSR